MISQLTSDTQRLPVSVAFSGPDNTGKTKQIGILARRMGAAATSAGPLDHYDGRWAAIKADGMSRWWFETGPVQEVSDVLATSYLERSRRPFSAPVRFLDRGIPMLEASLAATVGVRENLAEPQAADRARSLLAPYEADLRTAEADERPRAPALRGRRRRHPPEPVPRGRCHRHLRGLPTSPPQADQPAGHGRPVRHGDAHRRPADHHRPGRGPPAPCPSAPRHPRPGDGRRARHRARRHVGERQEHGRRVLTDAPRPRPPQDRLPDAGRGHPGGHRGPVPAGPGRAGRADRGRPGPLLRGHHFLDSISIESLHDFDSTAELARMLGPQLTITYLDASAAVRAQRGTAGAQDVADRDGIKSARGADKIVSLAQEVIGNDGPRLELERRLDRMALARKWPEHRPSTMPVNALGLPVHLESYLSELLDRLTGPQPLIDLLAVTGSGARGKYQHGWSDLDVFVVASVDALEGMRRVLAELEAELGGVKLGLTVLTRAECQSGAVTSRLLHVLALIGSGGLAPLWCAAGLALPAPDTNTDIDVSLRDGIQAAIEIRRQLLKGSPDLRDLYKVTALLAKIQLRFGGVECPSDHNALRRVVEARHQDTGMVAAARTERAAADELAMVVLRSWLATLPGDMT